MSERKLGEVLEEVKRPVDVVDEEEYRILGVRWYAEGAWVKKECAGSEIKAAKLYRVEAGDLIYNRLFAWKGSFAVIPQDLDGCYVSNEFPAFRVRDGNANTHYIFMLLSQPALWGAIERESAGVASISRKRLKVRDFLELELPLPSRRRQVEILDRYAPLKREVQELNERVVKSISDVAELRQTILQLAVMGRLVPQDPTDEPASELIKRIHAEKQRFIAEDTLRKAKSFPPINPDEAPFDLPTSWEWSRIGDLGCSFQNGLAKRRSAVGVPTVVLRLADIIDGRVRLADTRSIPLSPDERAKYQLFPDDILVTRVNGSIDLVGSFTLVREEDRLAYCDHYIRLRVLHGLILPALLELYGRTRLCREAIEDLFITTAGQKTVNQGHIRSLLFPVPPLPEQARIAAKVDQLMALCDDLEAKLQQAQQDADNLLTAIVHELVAETSGDA